MMIQTAATAVIEEVIATNSVAEHTVITTTFLRLFEQQVLQVILLSLAVHHEGSDAGKEERKGGRMNCRP